MAQEIGDTLPLMREKAQKRFDKIYKKNKHRREKYWIVMVYKPTKNTLDGRPILSTFIKAYFDKRPLDMVGTVIAEVDNIKGEVKWDIHLQDVNFDFSKVEGARESDDNLIATEKLGAFYNFG